jgi:hypothetical protein
MNMERFNVKKLKEGAVKNSIRFTALENFEDNGYMNRAWGTTKEHNNFGQSMYWSL